MSIAGLQEGLGNWWIRLVLWFTQCIDCIGHERIRSLYMLLYFSFLMDNTPEFTVATVDLHSVQIFHMQYMGVYALCVHTFILKTRHKLPIYGIHCITLSWELHSFVTLSNHLSIISGYFLLIFLIPK